MDLKRCSGILVHPTSFPNKYGIGDLGKSAYDFIEFLEKSNQKAWQVLPLGPTSFGDSPYQSFSTFAGNHLLISPDILLEEGYLEKEDLENIPSFDPQKVDFGSLINYKTDMFKKAYLNFKKASKTQRNGYEKFCKENASWLNDYVLFVALKNHFIIKRAENPGSNDYLEFKENYKDILTENQINDYFYGAVWTTWPEKIAKRDKIAISSYSKNLEDDMNFYKFLQYEFFREWFKLKDFVNKKGISIIGDIPIFVAFDSCDVWSNPKVFVLDSKGYPTVVAGVPPDYFSATGQLWGNPLYDWKYNKETGYSWWIERIKGNLSNMDILRIDHFRGFDTYWEIPFGSPDAVKGRWCKGPSKNLFEAIEKKLGKLPIIAEDLGEITPTVEVLRKYLNFPGMKILQFAFDDDSSNIYLPHNQKEDNTIMYTGTHDNDTTLGWYEKATELAKDNLRRYLNVSGEDIVWDMIRLSMSSVAVLSIVPIQDIMNLDSESRMNTPGIPSGNWQFRYKEDMLNEDIASKLLYLTKLFNR